MNIVTLLPSASEIVASLGAADSIVGVSHSCDFPEAVNGLPRVTSTHVPYENSSREIDEFVRTHLEDNHALYDLDVDALARLSPDVIVSQALCDVCAVATGDVLKALAALETRPQLVDLNPNTLDDVFADILRVGTAIGRRAEAHELLAGLSSRRERVAERSRSIAPADRPRVAFLEWLIPPFYGGHWNPELVELAGGIDVLGRAGEPSRTIDFADLHASRPDCIFIAACGFDKARSLDDLVLLNDDPAWRFLLESRQCKVLLANGDAYFARPGPRLIDGLEMLAHALHPNIHPPASAGSCDHYRVI